MIVGYCHYCECGWNFLYFNENSQRIWTWMKFLKLEKVYRLIHDMFSSQGVMTNEVMVKGHPKNGMWHEGCVGLEK